ncbi:hypothetical protein DDE83_001032 [Stemphylium lycopersici]|uniref:DUF6594 domain-containing protein n=1 Tax=Stemphylium lycopersici TaxID=183478 RepID=A0A364NE90_STELY|nr:hypothetical protein DDE83_001032 [Stemphylium lycopersici]
MEASGSYYSRLYEDVVNMPETAKFRRYLGYWAWMLYNETREIEKEIQNFNASIAEIYGAASSNVVVTALDYHLNYESEHHSKLNPHFDKLSSLIRRYGKDLKLARDVANLPDQPDIYAQHLAQYEGLFNDDMFGPTKEKAAIYTQVPANNDTCALKCGEQGQQDMLTKCMVMHLKPVNRFLEKWVLRIRGKSTDVADDSQRTLELATVLTVVDILSGIYVPVLFAGCLGVLSCLASEKCRIIVLGSFGMVLAALLIVCVPALKRNDLFAIIAAFFAVGGVYIGAKKDG